MTSLLRKFVMNISVLGAYTVVGGIALVLALFFAVILGVERYGLTQEMARLQQTVSVAQKGGALTHELQKERGMSAVVIASKGERFVSELSEQRKLTDAELAGLHDLLDNVDPESEVGLAAAEILEGFSDLANIRSNVDIQGINADMMLSYYSAKTNALINLYDIAVRQTGDGTLSAELESIGAFMRAKEAAGLERAIGARSFARGSYASGDYEYYIKLITTQDLYLERFDRISGEMGEGIATTIKRSDQQKALNEQRRIALSRILTDADPAAFFDAASARLGLLYNYEKQLVQVITDDLKSLAAGAMTQLVTMVAVTVAAMTVVIVAMVSFARIQSRVMRDVVDASQKMIAGNLDVKLPKAGKNDLSQLIRTLAMFRDSIRAARDAEQASMERERADVERMRQRTEEAQERTQRIAADLERTAQSTEELASAVASAVENSANANKHAIDMRKKADKGNAVVANAIEAMGRISAASGQITSIIKIIDEIAFQTNLLALNARVEAARAGHVGRGFAVVATEVQQLAARSAKAASDVGGLIRQSGAEIETGVAIVQESGETLTDIAQSAKDIAEVINTLADMSRQQSLAVTEINTATARLDQEMQLLSEGAAA